jgi:hypothetical protein
MRARPDDCGSVADNPGLVSPNVGPGPPTVSPIVGQKTAIISGQSADNLKPPHLPAGLAYDRSGAIVRNPDEEVQARLQLVFAKFTELQSARGVMRYLRAHDLPLPVRPLRGPAPHQVVWREANSARVRSILQNPAYAGAYVYGRRQADPVRRRGGARSATTKVALGEWAVCRPAAHPGYISWEAFMANQRRLADNINHYAAGHTGAPRRGSALVQGIAVCGRCGRRMSLR